MFRINLFLLFLTVACALALVTTQHKARYYYGELEKEKRKTHDLEMEYSRLLLEESTWMMSARIEEVSKSRLKMIKPGKEQIEIMAIDQFGVKE